MLHQAAALLIGSSRFFAYFAYACESNTHICSAEAVVMVASVGILCGPL